jgi:hypothetical protein
MPINYNNNNIATSEIFYKIIKPYIPVYDGIKLSMVCKHHHDNLADFRLRVMIMINEIDMYINNKIESIKEVINKGYIHYTYPAIITAYQMIYKDFTKEEIMEEIDDCFERATSIIITDILNGREPLPEHIDNDNPNPIDSDED